MTTADIAPILALLRKIHLMNSLDFRDIGTVLEIQAEAFTVSMPLRVELLKHEVKIN